MKIKGIVIVSPLMFQMEPGQKAFLDSNAAIFINNELFIDTRYSISTIKDDERDYIIPIERVGSGKEDFEIDFNISYSLYNQKFSEKKKKHILQNEYIIGPYKVETEIYQPTNYQKQTYPRMDLDDLIDSFSSINELLEDYPQYETYLDDKKVLRNLIIEKFKESPLIVLKKYERYFLPIIKEEQKNGEVSYVADKKIADFIFKQIEILTQMEGIMEIMSIEELTTEMNRLLKEENYMGAALYRDAINKKKSTAK